MKLPKFAPGQLWYIQWLDHASWSSGSAGAWNTPEQVKDVKPCVCETVGFIIANHKTHLVIASSIDVDNGNIQAVGSITIRLKSTIIQARQLKTLKDKS